MRAMHPLHTIVILTIACLPLCVSAENHVLPLDGNEEDVLVHLVDGRYIREWLVLGPFFPNEGEFDSLAHADDGQHHSPQEGDAVTTQEGRTLTWVPYKAKRRSADLPDAIGYEEHATAYAFCMLRSDRATRVYACIGHSNGATLWVNGDRVYASPNSVARDQSVFALELKAGLNPCLIKVSQETSTWAFALRVFPPNTAVISGTVTDDNNLPVFEASVRLEHATEEVAQVPTDEKGNYCCAISPTYPTYDIAVTYVDLGIRLADISFHEGGHQRLDFTLRQAVSIEGRLLMLDDITPHVAVVVEALLVGDDGTHRVVATTLSDEKGKYHFINLKPGRYHIQCQASDRGVYYYSKTKLSPRNVADATVIVVEQDRFLTRVDLRFPPFKQGTWRSYRTLDGLAANGVLTIHSQLDGTLWFGTLAGASRYDGKDLGVFHLS